MLANAKLTPYHEELGLDNYRRLAPPRYGVTQENTACSSLGIKLPASGLLLLLLLPRQQ